MSPNSPPPSKPNSTIKASHRFTILGLPIDRFSRESVLHTAVLLLRGKSASQIVTLNALMVLEAEKNPSLIQICEEAALVCADSSGITWAAARLNQGRLDRFPGIDLAFDLCRNCAIQGVAVYLLGGEPGVAEKAADNLKVLIPGLEIIKARDGYFKSEQEAQILDEIESSEARLFLVGLGMPKQELWINKHLSRFPGGVVVGVGGSLDVWAGKVKRAPRLVQKLGLEWLHRVMKEPFRFQRILQLPRFAWKVFFNG